MKTYLFFRGSEFYLIELPNDGEVLPNVQCNPGTTKVTDTDGNVLWEESNDRKPTPCQN